MSDDASGANLRNRLRREREALGLTQRELGDAAGLSAETIRKYEAGGRRPTRAHLNDILRVLRVSQLVAGDIMATAGFLPDETLLPSQAQAGYWYTVREAVAEMDSHPWPQFLSGSVMDIVAMNRAMALLWGVDLETAPLDRPETRIAVLPSIVGPMFSTRIVNFEEVLAAAVSILKGWPDGPTALDAPSPWADRLITELTASHPGAAGVLFDLWERVEPMRLRPRWSYPIVWREPEGIIRFHCLLGLANEPDGLSFNDWIPQDAESHGVLARVLDARAAALPGRPGRGGGRRRSDAAAH